MYEPSDIGALTTQFYEAVLEPERWEGALQSLVKAAGARGASLSRADFSLPGNSIVDVVGQSRQVVDEYHSHYVQFDPLLRLGPALASERWTSDWAVLGSSYRHSAYYNDFMKRHDNHAVLVAPLAVGESHTALLALQRSVRQGAFPAVPDELLVEVLPHLARAVKLHFATHDLRQQADFAAAALHRMPTPVMVVDSDAHMVLANRAGEHLLRTSKLLGVNGHRVAARLQDPPLQNAIREATAPGRAQPAWLRLAATAGEEALLLVVTPMSASSPHGRAWQRPLAVIMASRSGAAARKVDGILRELFNLTAAEARVAAAIAEGHSPAEIADRHDIAVLTVRGQLKSVYSKMGVRRQAELSRMLTKLQAMLPRHPEHD
jgi:DNA-binding CsgD family transcriptional regulator